jgi:hypothetical protein
MTFDQLYELYKHSLMNTMSKSPLPLWIALDEEGGTVTRLPSGRKPTFQMPEKWAVMDDVESD